MTQCSICLSAFKHPVCLPCGHIYCKECLNAHVNRPANQALTSDCPDCRAVFHLVAPDLNYLPAKYHPFISQAIRRVYVDTSSQVALEKELKEAKTRLKTKEASNVQLLNKCENLLAVVAAHRKGEKEARDKIVKIEAEAGEMKLDRKKQDQAIGKLKQENQSLGERYRQSQDRMNVLQAKIAQLQAQVDNATPAEQTPGPARVPKHPREISDEENGSRDGAAKSRRRVIRDYVRPGLPGADDYASLGAMIQMAKSRNAAALNNILRLPKDFWDLRGYDVQASRVSTSAAGPSALAPMPAQASTSTSISAPVRRVIPLPQRVRRSTGGGNADVSASNPWMSMDNPDEELPTSRHFGWNCQKI